LISSPRILAGAIVNDALAQSLIGIIDASFKKILCEKELEAFAGCINRCSFSSASVGVKAGSNISSIKIY